MDSDASPPPSGDVPHDRPRNSSKDSPGDFPKDSSGDDPSGGAPGDHLPDALLDLSAQRSHASGDTPGHAPSHAPSDTLGATRAVVIGRADADAPGATCPLMLSHVPAGFPSPADDFEDEPLDIADYLIDRPETTYFVRAEGDSMTGVGIDDGDLLVVDRAREPQNGDVVVAALNGVLTVKRLERTADALYLAAENPGYEAIEVSPYEDLVVWGVVRHVVRKVS